MALWLIFLPYPHDICVLVAIAVAVIALATTTFSHGILNIEGGRSDPRPAIDGLYFGPAIGLAMRALSDFNLLDWQAALLFTFALAAALMGLLLAFDRGLSRKPSAAVAVLFATSALAYGFVCETNAMLDASLPKVFQTVVADKQVTHGRGSTTFNLVLGSSGTWAAGQRLHVTRAYYRAVGIGQTVCVTLRSGAWGIRYADAGPCRSQPDT